MYKRVGCMKETSCEYWFVIYRESKVGQLKVMKVRGIKLSVVKHVRSCGYSVPLAYSFDNLYDTQKLTEREFIKRNKAYAKGGYYEFIQKIDLWDNFPKYSKLEQVPKNERGK